MMVNGEEDNLEYASTPIIKDDEIINYQETSDDKVPVDSFNFIYFIMLLQGVGVLFPWNSFIAAPDYFIAVYKDNQILSYFSVVYSYPNLFGLVVMIFIGYKIPIQIRVMGTFAAFFFLLLTIPILGFAQIQNAPVIGLIITFTVLVFLAFGTSILQGSIFGLAGILPPKYMVATMAGNGWAGLIVSSIRVATKGLIESGGHEPTIFDITLSTSIYFFISCFFVFLCFVSFFFAWRTKFVQYYYLKSLEKDETQIIDESSKKEPFYKSIISITKKMWTFEVYVFANFVITIGLFPSTIFGFKSAYGPVMQNWLPIILGLVFNIGDVIGRGAPGYYLVSKRYVPYLTISRLIFVPLFLLCIKPRLITNDILMVLIMLAFSVSNGYCSTISMIHGPSTCSPNERYEASTIMTFMLVFGIVMGSNLGVILGLIYN
eukprot:gene2137-2003_t